MDSFTKISTKFGVNEHHFFYEFHGLDCIDNCLAKSNNYFANLIGWEYVKFYKECGLDLIDLKGDEAPPPGVSHLEWMEILTKLWNLYD
jgi:hypothetical protein